MGGPNSQDYKRQSDIAQQQVDLAKSQSTTAAADRAKMDKLLQPSIDFNTAVTKDPQSQLVAAAPMIGQIAKGEKAAEEQIFESIPAGPARDMALAEAKRGKASDIATTRNNIFTTALDKLANIGSGLGSFSLQELGAALTGFQGGAATGQGVIQNKAQTKAATTGMIGDFAMAAGGAAGAHCWIAEAIYGVDDPRTHLIRAWLGGPFAETWLGSKVMTLYRAFGQRIAAVARRSPSLRAILRPLFEAALRRALAWYPEGLDDQAHFSGKPQPAMLNL